MKSHSHAVLSLRTPLMDNWYSLSYLYFSTLGTLVTILVGMLVSLPTGNYLNPSIAVFFLPLHQFVLYLFSSSLCYFTIVLLTSTLIVYSILLIRKIEGRRLISI